LSVKVLMKTVKDIVATNYVHVTRYSYYAKQ
jgi:hypothetical protein